MNEITDLDTMIEALAEITQEDNETEPALSTGEPELPTLASVIADASPLPDEALFLGLADDGLPVLLNLFDPVPGPLLVVGDAKCGKTRLMQTIARAVDMLHSPDDVKYVIITEKPDEWQDFHNNDNNAGIFVTDESNTRELINSLMEWAHNNKGEQQSILLFIDDLEPISELDPQVEQNIRWLLLRGPARHIWPIVSLRSNRAEAMKAWMNFFRSRLFGHIEKEEVSEQIIGTSKFDLSKLEKGSQFAMLEGDNLLKFIAPSI